LVELFISKRYKVNGVASILILKTTNPLGLKMKMHPSYQHLLNLA
jgi:hypothetical protein